MRDDDVGREEDEKEDCDKWRVKSQENDGRKSGKEKRKKVIEHALNKIGNRCDASVHAVDDFPGDFVIKVSDV